MTVDDYQRDHELPAGRGLVAEDLREQMAERQRWRMAHEEGLIEKVEAGQVSGHVLRDAARRGREASKNRAGVRAAWQEGARRSAELKTRETRERQDTIARGHGYTDIEDLLNGTRNLTARDLGQILGVSPTVAKKLRSRYGVRSRSKQAAGVARRRDRQRTDERLRRVELGRVEPGVQPENSEGLQCLECSRWYRNLALHLGLAHQLTSADYRRKHELLASQPLVVEALRDALAERFRRLRATDPQFEDARVNGAARLAANHEKAMAGSRAAAQRPEIRRQRQRAQAQAAAARRSQARARHDARARELGHPDLLALLAATAHLTQRELGALIGISPMQAGRLRNQDRDR